MIRAAVLLLAFWCLVGCSRREGPLRPYTGEWRCDEEASFSYWIKQAKTPEDREWTQKEIALRKQLSVKIKRGLHPDIRVRPHRIEGFGEILSPSYDVLRFEEKEGAVHTRVLHHEDKNDPGDAEEISMRVFMVGEKLALHLKSDGGEFETTYLFSR